MFEDSTHGGRQRNRAGCVGTHHFNSRPHGGRHPARCPVPFPGYFNSRPHGGRRFFRSLYFYRDYFNSRPHGGRPIDWRSSPIYFSISTHALTEGDLEFFGLLKGDDISPHALTEGDLTLCQAFRQSPVFQLTPSRRATTYIVRRIRRSCISTHALTEGD